MMRTRRRKRPQTEERRNVLRGLATGFAGAVAVPGVASEVTAGASAQAALAVGAAAAPALLNESELVTLESLSELLVPGSVAAGVPELLDRVAFVETRESQRELLDALRAFEGEARLRHARTWVGLDDVSRRDLLEQAATASETPLNAHFVALRDRVARAFFSTELGMQKLGWTRRSAWRELPGCNHSGDDHR